ncbi:PBP1A family penicillin-binding protein [Hydrogenophaga sp.]|uniref:penicillin-binding protein 1A n=1 Tax=Hydrogenophaga sp. TaxID=1904254 RepID=UPI0019BB00C1|nr:PBP1A family penicillin-binding protein [Hydrogenophaga sp.]MBD3892905.1 PBP1A family penicillin-binding protein [Hydrogenophaga sp.]
MLLSLLRPAMLVLALTPAATWANPPGASSAFDLPSIDPIVNYQPKLPLTVLTADGVEIAQFGTERREFVPLARTPRLLQQAVLAVEDTRFHAHPGIDPKGMARAAVAMLTGGRRQGASTITQQLVRTMLLTPAFSAERKAKEIVLALQVEQVLSKERILEIYLNEIFLGQRAYGFAMAAQTYFGKPMDQLSLAEIAMLAGLPQNPSFANPVANFERAVQRQRVVLERMRVTGVISAAQHAGARAEPLRIRPPGQRSVHAPHVAEMARRLVVERFGTEAYSRGLRVLTSLRAAEQQAAHQALRRGVLAFDRRGPWRGPHDHAALPSAEGTHLQYAAAQALREQRDDELLRVAIVLAASPQELRLQLASGEQVRVRGESLRWARRGLGPNAPAALRITRGSIVRLLQTGTDWQLAQWPEVEAALVALDTHSGRVRALVGGFDFTRQPFNHATQAWRQPGSVIKPLLYSAALEQRVMPATLIDDLPWRAANGWSPDNSDGLHRGPITLRSALEHSSNLVSVRVLQHVGMPRMRDWSSRFGLDAARQPDNLTLALGSGSSTPLQMARAYATLANGGWPVNPVVIERITDAQGRVLFEAAPPSPASEERRVISERNAFVMSSLLNDVTRSGTAARAQAQLGRRDIYGKTGTTDNAVDAWFVGYHPTLAAAVWVGHSQPRSLGAGESGGRLALPIWIDFMAAALRQTPVSPAPTPPAGLVHADGDWRYSEWLSGGWVSHLSDQETRLATVAAAPLPPGAEVEPGPGPQATPESLQELVEGLARPAPMPAQSHP